MEKNIEVICRYHYTDGYYVEVTHEKSALAERDYWLCKRGNAKKMYMFSAVYRNERREEDMILKQIRGAVERYENPVRNMRWA